MLNLSNYFSNPEVSPYEEIKWVTTKAEITDDTGKVIFSQNVTFPDYFSELAKKIVAAKYFYRGENETHVGELVHRVCSTIADWGIADGYFNQENGNIFYQELSWLCLHQYGAFNSPVWFNVGLYEKYGAGMHSTQGGWHWDTETAKPVRASSQYEYPQCSACFIQSVDDNMESIMALATSEAMLFKHGSGTGSDLSTIRSSKEKLSGGGVPSGPLSFLKIYDQVANVVKSGGKTRRAAKMNTLYDWHGDIEEFIEVKSVEERKIRALVNAGYSTSLADPNSAYSTALYQNENLSVRVTDEFMEAVEKDLPWQTKAVTTGEVLETKSAKELFHKIAEGTWFCGDPGLQFDSTIQKWHTCKASGKITSSNPCSEYLFLNDSACNLASLNLLKFKKENGDFDIEAFEHAIEIFIIAQDILVDRSSYPTAKICENSHNFRPLGLGIANLGALCMSYGYPYDSDQARMLASCVTSLLTGWAYNTSHCIAEQTDCFEKIHINGESLNDVKQLHRTCTASIKPPLTAGDNINAIYKEATKVWEEVDLSALFRNAQVTVSAPTGTIGFMMDCDTTGIEPDIALVKYKSLVGGGLLKIVNNTVKDALQTLGYNQSDIDAIIAHIEKYDTIEDVTIDGIKHITPLKKEHLSVFDCAFKPVMGKRFISPLGHLKMMAAVQPYISGAISKTVNMPSDCTIEDIENAYMTAWKLGLKAVAIYRDGSKASQPLKTSKDKKEENEKRLKEAIDFVKTELPTRRRLQNTRAAINHKFNIAGHEGYLTVGLYEDGTPGELFITMAKEGSTIGGLMDCFSTAISYCLQYGVPLEDLVAKFSYQRFEPWGFTNNKQIRNATSIMDYIFRWLKLNFIDNKATIQKNLNVAPTTEDSSVTTTSRDSRQVQDSVCAKNAQTQNSVVAKNTTTHNSLSDSVKHFQKDAPLCPTCGNITVRNGSCYKCLNCGESLGCS